MTNSALSSVYFLGWHSWVTQGVWGPPQSLGLPLVGGMWAATRWDSTSKALLFSVRWICHLSLQRKFLPDSCTQPKAPDTCWGIQPTQPKVLSCRDQCKIFVSSFDVYIYIFLEFILKVHIHYINPAISLVQIHLKRIKAWHLIQVPLLRTRILLMLAGSASQMLKASLCLMVRPEPSTAVKYLDSHLHTQMSIAGLSVVKKQNEKQRKCDW